MKNRTLIKKLFALTLALVMALSLAACSGGTISSDDGPTANVGKKTFKVGICNFVDDPSLNQIIENIQAQLEAVGKEKGVTFDVKVDNCNMDTAVLNQIIANFIADKVDLMVGVATPVAMAMQAATEDNKIPVVFSAVSDPLSAGLVASLEKPGANLTGTSDFLNTNALLDMVFAVDPAAAKIGLLYNPGEDSSTTPIRDAKAYLDAKGIPYVERTGTNVAEVTQAAQSLVSDGVSAVFTPTDNTIMNAELSIYEVFANAGIPHYAGADSFALWGAFLGFGVDYANLGRETGNMVAAVLVDGKDPATLPVMTFDNGIATVNTETCAAIGLDFADVQTRISPKCTKVQSIVTGDSF